MGLKELDDLCWLDTQRHLPHVDERGRHHAHHSRRHWPRLGWYYARPPCRPNVTKGHCLRRFTGRSQVSKGGMAWLRGFLARAR
jgi:hypothetical protein